MKRLPMVIIALISFTAIFSQDVSTLAKIESNYGDGMIVTPDGDILVSGGYNKTTILKVTPNGKVSTYIDDLPGPVGMGFDSKGNLYVSNYTGNSIIKITPNKVVSDFAKNLDGPAGLAVDENDDIFVTLYGAGFSGTGGKILKFKPDGSFVEYFTGNGLQDAIGIIFDNQKNIYTTNFVGGDLFKVGVNKQMSKPASIPNAKINQITYFDHYVYLPSPNLRKIFRYNVLNGKLEHFAGTGEENVTDGTLKASEFNMPNSCAIDASNGKLYILEHKLGLIREITF
ncbi:Vgb family protein [Lutibacter maritimus]|uniref:SMP-30/Gluconolaconase/LRE-like region-containing protein n=1 Tax=Lutibacter maritimus TaxID=593133 RepID=A0A1I6RZC4_9FLAO|nr:hypothetical protein [Lutibacter maritimus]SFS69950.1 hypothetical protein SAMN04488006_2668 [Lutibacter maritimus]